MSEQKQDGAQRRHAAGSGEQFLASSTSTASSATVSGGAGASGAGSFETALVTEGSRGDQLQPLPRQQQIENPKAAAPPLFSINYDDDGNPVFAGASTADQPLAGNPSVQQQQQERSGKEAADTAPPPSPLPKSLQRELGSSESTDGPLEKDQVAHLYQVLKTVELGDKHYVHKKQRMNRLNALALPWLRREKAYTVEFAYRTVLFKNSWSSATRSRRSTHCPISRCSRATTSPSSCRLPAPLSLSSRSTRLASRLAPPPRLALLPLAPIFVWLCRACRGV
jgi:hypothetical protein